MKDQVSVKDENDSVKTSQDTEVKEDAALDLKEETEAKKDRGFKKRKWSSKTSKTAKVPKKATSMEISTDSLKNLIGEVKIESAKLETVFDMETDDVNTLDYDEHEEDQRDVKVKRTVIQTTQESEAGDMKEEIQQDDGEDDRKVEAQSDQESPKERKEEAGGQEEGKDAEKAPAKKKVKDGKKVKKKKNTDGSAEGKENKSEAGKDKPGRIIATTRSVKPILPVVDEPEVVAASQSPARNPADRVIRIAGLVRPFTLGQLKELLRRYGDLDDEYFWINDIKSHCLAAFKSEEDSVKARTGLHGSRWPSSNPKLLIVDYAAIEDVQHRKAHGDVPLPVLNQKRPDERKRKEEEQEKERLKAREAREKEREGREKEQKDKRDGRDSTRDRDKRRDSDKAPTQPVREWDRDKMQQLSRSRSRSKERERAGPRSRSRSRDQRKRRGSREKKDDEKKKEKKPKEKTDEEPPAKLLDDLFRKTKATPCIYWLPLTEEQAQERAVQKAEKEKEIQKRRAAAEEREKQDQKKREAARLERQREREKMRDRSRDKSRDRSRDKVRERSREKSRDRDRERERARVDRRRSRSRSRSADRRRRR